MIETTYTKFGKGPGGDNLIGVTTQPQTSKVCTKSQHIQNKLLNGLEYLRNKDESPNQIHKEETKDRIASDNKDRKKAETFYQDLYTPT